MFDGIWSESLVLVFGGWLESEVLWSSIEHDLVLSLVDSALLGVLVTSVVELVPLLGVHIALLLLLSVLVGDVMANCSAFEVVLLDQFLLLLL